MASRNNEESTKTRIIKAATKLFAEQGYQKATIAEISKLAGLSEAALYEYFQGKEDLLLTIPEVWVNEAIDEVEEQIFGIKGSFNKLRKFLWWYLRYIEKEPLTAKVVFLSLKTNANFVSTPVYPKVKTFYSVLVKIFEEGRDSGEMKPDLNPYIARSIFLGTIEHMVIRWLLKDMSYSLFDHLDHIFDIFFDAFKKNPSKNGTLS
jgi:TetR/AcrR family transcriptional regulator, fatty acid metabolism regulator protein